MIEVPVPFGVFGWGWVRVVTAVLLAGLMAGIQLTGNFGKGRVLLSWFFPAFDLSTDPLFLSSQASSIC